MRRAVLTKALWNAADRVSDRVYKDGGRWDAWLVIARSHRASKDARLSTGYGDVAIQESRGALRSPGLLRVARNDDRLSSRSDLLETRAAERGAMTRDDYDAFCKNLPHVTHVVQWGDASVWKIGGKVFAIGGWFDGPEFAVTFKCSEASFPILKDLPGLRPAPYLASRGLSWVQRVDSRSLSDHDLKQYIRQSYAMILAALPKKTQEALRARI